MKKAISFENFQDRVKHEFNNISPKLKKVAQYMIDNQHLVAIENIATIAKNIKVYPSAVIRFCQHFGFSGFSEVQDIFRKEFLNSHMNNYTARISKLETTGYKADNVLHKQIAEGIFDLEKLTNSITEEDILKAVKLIINAEHIYIIGKNRSFSVAFYLFYALSNMNHKPILIDSIAGTTLLHSKHITNKDVILAISFYPYSEDILAICKAKQKEKIPIITISDSKIGGLAPFSMINFSINESNKIFRSLTGAMCLAQSLVVMCGIEGNKHH